MRQPIDFSLIPDHCRDGVRRYILNGEPVGGFLTAVFECDFPALCFKADTQNQRHLMRYASFLAHRAPSRAWGSADKVRLWISNGGLRARAFHITVAPDEPGKVGVRLWEKWQCSDHPNDWQADLLALIVVDTSEAVVAMVERFHKQRLVSESVID